MIFLLDEKPGVSYGKFYHETKTNEKHPSGQTGALLIGGSE